MEHLTLKIYYIYSCKLDDIHYFYWSNKFLFSSANKYSQIYADVMANQDDVTNQKTLNAFHFVPKLYADYAKTGYVIKYYLFIFWSFSRPQMLP